jgi:hypothetical protein
MRRGTALLLLLAACGDEPKAPDPPPRPPEPPPIEDLKWKHVEGTRKLAWDIEIQVPAAWIEGHKVIEEGRQVHFRGPVEDQGFFPELQFGWMATSTPVGDLVEKRIRDLTSRGGGRIESRTATTVAGLPGTCYVYGWQAGGKEMREIAFYYGSGGFIGLVRGVSTARTFAACLPVFREAAARVRYNPQ